MLQQEMYLETLSIQFACHAAQTRHCGVAARDAGLENKQSDWTPAKRKKKKRNFHIDFSFEQPHFIFMPSAGFMAAISS